MASPRSFGCNKSFIFCKVLWQKVSPTFNLTYLPEATFSFCMNTTTSFDVGVVGKGKATTRLSQFSVAGGDRRRVGAFQSDCSFPRIIFTRPAVSLLPKRGSRPRQAEFKFIGRPNDMPYLLRGTERADSSYASFHGAPLIEQGLSHQNWQAGFVVE